MKSEKNIFIAFILNLAFSIFEFIGGIFTGSVAIISDSIHDIGDAASIGIAFFLEKKSRKKPNEKYTYGYFGYSVIGGAITNLILLLGSAAVICNAIFRLVHPSPIRYDGMILLAVIGTAVNLIAALVTRGGGSVNQRAINLHMLEDVLGWVIVLIGAILMRFTDLYVIDPLMSIGVAIFISVNAFVGLRDIVYIFLQRVPCDADIEDIKKHLLEIDGVLSLHHLHVWSIDGIRNCATLHIVVSDGASGVKERVRGELREHGIQHATLELEAKDEVCGEECCRFDLPSPHAHSHHHHHHHNH